MSLMSNYCCISFLKSLKILRFKKKPLKTPKKYKATPLDYTIVKLHNCIILRKFHYLSKGNQCAVGYITKIPTLKAWSIMRII
ncbi:hypothetical protein HpBHB23_11750 [Helicobacter pylori]